MNNLGRFRSWSFLHAVSSRDSGMLLTASSISSHLTGLIPLLSAMSEMSLSLTEIYHAWLDYCTTSASRLRSSNKIRFLSFHSSDASVNHIFCSRGTFYRLSQLSWHFSPSWPRWWRRSSSDSHVLAEEQEFVTLQAPPMHTEREPSHLRWR